MSCNSCDSLSRRDALALLGGGALAARAVSAAAGSPFDLTGIDHVALTVAEVGKSLAFYTRVFGNTAMRDNHGPRSYVKVGPNYVAMAPVGKGREVSGAYQICLGIKDFQLSDVKRSLVQFDIQHHEVKGQGVLIPDPDGILIQLWAENSWSELAKTASPLSVPGSGARLLRPTEMNHLLLAVSDPEKSALFYEKILGPIAQRTPPQPPLSGRIWFRAGKRRIGLAPLNQGLNTSGQRPGVDHFGLIAPFEREELTKELRDANATVLPQAQGADAAGIDFRDVNGIRLQVLPPPRPRA